MPPGTLKAHKIDRFHPQKADQLIGYSHPGREKQKDHAAHDHRGDKIGGIGNGLNHLGVLFMPKGIEEQSQNNGDGESCGQRIDAQNKGIENDLQRVGGAQKPGEVGKAHPGAAPNAPAHRIIAEGDLYAVNGPVMIDEGNDHARNAEQPEFFALKYPREKRLALIQ